MGRLPFSSRGASIVWCERRGVGEVEWPQFVVLAVRCARSSLCWQGGEGGAGQREEEGGRGSEGEGRGPVRPALVCTYLYIYRQCFSVLASTPLTLGRGSWTGTGTRLRVALEKCIPSSRHCLCGLALLGRPYYPFSSLPNASGLVQACPPPGRLCALTTPPSTYRVERSCGRAPSICVGNIERGMQCNTCAIRRLQ